MSDPHLTLPQLLRRMRAESDLDREDARLARLMGVSYGRFITRQIAVSARPAGAARSPIGRGGAAHA